MAGNLLRKAFRSSFPTLSHSRQFSKVKFSFLEASSKDRIEVTAEEGKTVLDVAIENNVDIEGACGGELACSTCHVVVPKDLYDRLPPKKEEEEDMLDLAWGLTDTSRLCCQIKVSKELEGQTFVIPAETNNMFAAPTLQ